MNSSWGAGPVRTLAAAVAVAVTVAVLAGPSDAAADPAAPAVPTTEAAPPVLTWVP